MSNPLNQVVEILKTRTPDALDRAITVGELYLLQSGSSGSEKLKSIAVTITRHVVMHTWGATAPVIYEVSCVMGDSAWSETIIDKDEMATFLRGLKAAATLCGLTVTEKSVMGAPYRRDESEMCPICTKRLRVVGQMNCVQCEANARS